MTQSAITRRDMIGGSAAGAVVTAGAASLAAAGEARAQVPRTTFVLVHGAA